jgi:hypothetical protein
MTAGHRFTGKPGQRNAAGKLTDAAGVRRLQVGWEYVHIAIDDATRLAYVEVLANEKAITAVGFLRRAVTHFASYGITTERLITDNGSAYRSTVHAIACRALGIRHLRTRPYGPQTNGKAERFIRTMLGGWAYGAIYRTSAERNAALAGWLDYYNRRRPHGALSHKPPIARLNELNNLLASYIAARANTMSLTQPKSWGVSGFVSPSGRSRTHPSNSSGLSDIVFARRRLPRSVEGRFARRADSRAASQMPIAQRTPAASAHDVRIAPVRRRTTGTSCAQPTGPGIGRCSEPRPFARSVPLP